MKDGFIKVAAGTPEIRLADPLFNAEKIIELMREAEERGVKLLCLPELCLTGATCGDLFFQSALLRGVEEGFEQILSASGGLDVVCAFGLPYIQEGRLRNCVAVVRNCEVLGLWAKTRLSPQERRWFAPGEGPQPWLECANVEGLTLAVSAGEEPEAQGPAAVLLNPFASPALVGEDSRRREALKVLSRQSHCAILSAGAGAGESAANGVYLGRRYLVENGQLLAQGGGVGLSISEVDLNALAACRLFQEPSQVAAGCPKGGSFTLKTGETELTRKIPKNPFVPEDPGELSARCEEILDIASAALARRLAHTGAKTAVIGLSGGLDSTLAALITHRALTLLGRRPGDMLAVTMPCFGTTSRTKSNAQRLAEALGATFKTIDIGKAVTQHFADIGQAPDNHDVTFENAQARERTQVLMDLANQTGGLVVGTGDLSEFALGWCTYNGDHMSMYGVNSSIPKTLMRHVVDFVARSTPDPHLRATLLDILATPVSPELLPPKEGEISQKTEELVGPYDLHDFFLYYVLRWGFSPKKILRLAKIAFSDEFSEEIVTKWLKTFYRRFFSQQFKRNCSPDGPKVGSVNFQDFQMPSDAQAALWLSQLEEL